MGLYIFQIMDCFNIFSKMDWMFKQSSQQKSLFIAYEWKRLRRTTYLINGEEFTTAGDHIGLLGIDVLKSVVLHVAGKLLYLFTQPSANAYTIYKYVRFNP